MPAITGVAPRSFGRVVHKSNEPHASVRMATQMRKVCQAFAKMEVIPGSGDGQQFYHAYSLNALLNFRDNLETLAASPGATPDWAVGYSHSNSRKTIRWNMEWKADGGLLNMKHTTTFRPTMTKKNLLDAHTSDQKWVNETANFHSNVFIQARLGEWLAYAETEIEKLQKWDYDQKLRQISLQASHESKKIEDTERQIESLHAYIAQVSDPDYIKTYVQNQITQTEAKIETLNKAMEGFEHSLEKAQARVDEFVESHKV
tara:strand:+ start:769 stop:1545 length:777 start_codon:yes stop_codon:yes gene_type:complete